MVVFFVRSSQSELVARLFNISEEALRHALIFNEK